MFCYSIGNTTKRDYTHGRRRDEHLRKDTLPILTDRVLITRTLVQPL
jgi:hypothetical protein